MVVISFIAVVEFIAYCIQCTTSESEKILKVKFVDISQTKSASEIIFSALRKAIIEGDITVGTPLRQDELARSFQTSRIPVREALSRLEEQGLIKTQRFKGSVVVGLSADEASEIFNLRALLEPEILRNAVPRMSDPTKQLAIVQCNDFSKSTDPLAWGDLNRIFHHTLYADSDQTFTREVADNAMDRVDRYIRAQLVVSDGMDKAKSEHLEILDACLSNNADLAAELLRDHILGAKESLLASFPTLPN
jgi:DNA-binding GntR family transcriptional regulator